MSMVVTNIGKERELTIGHVYDPWRPVAKMYDDSGNEYSPKVFRLANHGGYTASAFLLSGIPVKASVRFEGVSPESKMIPLFYLFAGDYRVEFRNLPLSR